MTTDNEEVIAQEEVDSLLEDIRAVDKQATLDQLEFMKSIVLQHPTLFALVITPSVISTLHNEIVENFKINRRFLQLRRRIDNKRKVAELFLQAMINGVNSYNE